MCNTERYFCTDQLYTASFCVLSPSYLVCDLRLLRVKPHLENLNRENTTTVGDHSLKGFRENLVAFVKRYSVLCEESCQKLYTGACLQADLAVFKGRLHRLGNNSASISMCGDTFYEVYTLPTIASSQFPRLWKRPSNV